MRAVVMREFGRPPELLDVPVPPVPADGVLVAVEATGLCRSDWHTWQGHDAGVTLPHVAGHELAGEVVAVGADVRRWSPGGRVTVPFVLACGHCTSCMRGDQQVCEDQQQPGATYWGSFADYVVLPRADANLVTIPDGLSSVAAAALGCRFATAYGAVVRQGRVRPGQWVAVHGCGGVGLSAVLVAVACGASVVAVDVSSAALDRARTLGAALGVDATGLTPQGVAAAVREATDGGADLSLDCLGSPATCAASVSSLRRKGRHVQAGLMPPEQGPAMVPMDRVIAWELELVGVHGLAAHDYPALLDLVASSAIDLESLVGRRIGLQDLPDALARMSDPAGTQAGVTVVDLRGDLVGP